MGIVVIGAVFVDIKGYPLSTYIPRRTERRPPLNRCMAV